MPSFYNFRCLIKIQIKILKIESIKQVHHLKCGILIKFLIVNIRLMLVNINLFSQLDMMPDLTNSPTLICIYKSNIMCMSCNWKKHSLNDKYSQSKHIKNWLSFLVIGKKMLRLLIVTVLLASCQIWYSIGLLTNVGYRI